MDKEDQRPKEENPKEEKPNTNINIPTLANLKKGIENELSKNENNFNGFLGLNNPKK